MTVESAAARPVPANGAQAAPFLGFTNILRKEITEWLRGRAALIVGVLGIAAAVFTTLIPFVVQATGEAAQAGPPLSMDPTVNVLLGWSGGQTVAIITILATMSLLTAERDRGTLAWTLTKPVSSTSVIAAKFLAALLVLATATVLLPLAVASAVATVAYGAVPDLGTVASFGGLFLTVPIFYIGLTVALGTTVKSTAGVAGLAFLVMFLPGVLGSLVPAIAELSPTTIGTWALATATGGPSSIATPAGWAISMAVIATGAKLAIDRQEF